MPTPMSVSKTRDMLDEARKKAIKDEHMRLEQLTQDTLTALADARENAEQRQRPSNWEQQTINDRGTIDKAVRTDWLTGTLTVPDLDRADIRGDASDLTRSVNQLSAILERVKPATARAKTSRGDKSAEEPTSDETRPEEADVVKGRQKEPRTKDIVKDQDSCSAEMPPSERVGSTVSKRSEKRAKKERKESKKGSSEKTKERHRR